MKTAKQICGSYVKADKLTHQKDAITFALTTYFNSTASNIWSVTSGISQYVHISAVNAVRHDICTSMSDILH